MQIMTFPCNVDVIMIFMLLIRARQSLFGSSLIYLQLFAGGIMSYLRYLCLLTYCGVKRILCCVFDLFVFILFTRELEDTKMVIRIYKSKKDRQYNVPYVASVSGFSLFDCPFGIL